MFLYVLKDLLEKSVFIKKECNLDYNKYKEETGAAILAKIIGAEEKDKAELIDKGMGIYASVDTPDEIQVLFPEAETERFLTDNITKLLTENKQLDKGK